jgi:hypothetical protein
MYFLLLTPEHKYIRSGFLTGKVANYTVSWDDGAWGIVVVKALRY